MKNIFLKPLCLTLLGIFIMSCSKDDETASFQKENFMAEYLALSQFDEDVTNNVNLGDFEFGVEFTPKAKGIITSIIVQSPDANNELRVTFWDAETKTPIRTETVNVETADTQFTFSINELAVQKDKKYMITMNSDDWYRRSKTNNEAIVYPLEVGNLEINSYGYFNGSEQTYPNNFQTNYYAGDLSFDFERTE